jgi:AcrR family transcriptional regulator
MATVTRKQREMIEREAQILRLARPILLREGYQALSMDRLASLMEYAKGTIYNHFPNKEEIVLALAVESMELRFQLFQAASQGAPGTRERLIYVGAACEFYANELPEHFAIEEWIRNSTIWDKSSPKRQELIRQCEQKCMSVVAAIVHDALVSGELELSDGLSPAELIFGFWSLNYGSQVLAATSPSLLSVGVSDAPKAIRHHCLTLLNGFNWKPAMDWSSHSAWMDRFRNELRAQFAEYLPPS